jgi:hypothetical protein
MTPDEIAAANEDLVQAYRLTFKSPWGQKVVLDLMKDCYFRIPLPIEDRDVAEGKRQAFLRIMSFLNFSPEQLGRLFAGQPIPTGDSDG